MNYKSLFLNNIKIDSSWTPFTDDQTDKMLCDIENKITKDNIADYTPVKERVLHFMTLPLNDITVIILGQDPYPQKGVATGRAFEVGTLDSWFDTFNNTSLKNIVRALYRLKTGEILKYSEIIKLYQDNRDDFFLLPPSKLFTLWEKQGVLPLNTAFTCKIGKPGSHSELWKPFFSKVLDYINFYDTKHTIYWLLWGRHAQGYKDMIKSGRILACDHPMMCYDKKGDFLFNENLHFEKTSSVINWI